MQNVKLLIEHWSSELDMGSMMIARLAAVAAPQNGVPQPRLNDMWRKSIAEMLPFTNRASSQVVAFIDASHI